MPKNPELVNTGKCKYLTDEGKCNFRRFHLPAQVPTPNSATPSAEPKIPDTCDVASSVDKQKLCDSYELGSRGKIAGT